jgi:type IV secretion system protein VirB6
MSSFCAQQPGQGVALQLLADADCHAFGLVEQGYAALAAPTGPVAATVNSLLVIAVAVFGYRLILGRGPVLADAVSLAIRIGIVLAIATSWNSFQALAYDSVARAPIRIAGEMIATVDSTDPLLRLQQILDSIEAASVGYRTRAGIASPLVGGPAASAMTLNLSSIILSQSIAGLLAVCRILMAILLALAPLMAGFALFDSTRGVAAGWLSTLLMTALAPVFILVVAAIELAVLGPLIERNLSEQARGLFEPETVTPIGLVVTVFAIAMIGGLIASARISAGINIPKLGQWRRSVPMTDRSSLMTPGSVVAAFNGPEAIAAALARGARRESGAVRSPAGGLQSVPGLRSRAAASSIIVPTSEAVVRNRLQASNYRLTGARLPRPSRAAARRDG